MLTLQLDQRYEVIAYVIAYGSLMKGTKSLVDGFPVYWIRGETLRWWRDGFYDTLSEDSFRALLDEMVGLGVLRVVNKNCYTLRSPNVVTLMGTQEEIEAELLKNREAPLQYEPSSFRSAFRESDMPDYTRRNPLSAQQQSEIIGRRNGVSIIFGCEAAGLSDIEHFLKQAVGKEFFIKIDNISDKTIFTKQLDDLDKREKYGTTILFVVPNLPWSEDWVDAAIQKVERLKSINSFVRILFIADPQTTWHFFALSKEEIGALSSRGVTFFSLGPWKDPATRQWFEDCGFGPSDKQGRDKISAVTGNWPILFKRLHECSKYDHLWERCLEAVANSLNDPEVIREMERSMGLCRQEAKVIFQDLRELNEASLEDLISITERIPPEIIEQCLRWADALSLVIPVGDNVWRIDPVVGRIVESASRVEKVGRS